VIETLLAHAKAKAARTAQSMALAVVAGVAGLVALAFFLAALFAWLAPQFGAVAACLMFAGGFVVIALAAAVTVVVLRRRPPPPLDVAAAMPWNDPTVMMGLDLAKSLGEKRGGAISLLGAFAVGILLSRTLGRK
jgi:hypothetical protein